MQKTDELVNTLVKAVSDIQNKKAKGYDTQAKVTRIEGNTAYVHIPGGVDETPAQLTINAKKGDQVRVRVAGGTAWLVGNASNPPTDDAVANAASAVANTASTMAGEAIESANIAQEAAESAQASAAEAKVSAQEAKASATEANNHANSALTQLGIVEDVVDVLNWITAHGIYVVTSDTEVVAGKYYFEATAVADPSGNPREQNYFEYNSTTQKYVLSTDTTVVSGKTYYTIEQVTTTITDPTGYLELNSVDEAVASYVQSHLALTDEGLYVVKDNQGYKILLANDGMKVYDSTGALVATYGENITFSATRPQTIGGVNSYIKYLQENGQWKIKVVADVIEFTGGESVASTSDVSTAQAAAISTAAADATTKADAAQAAAVSTAAADATTKANDAKKVATNYLTFDSTNGLDVGASGLSSKVNIKSDGVRIYDGSGNLGNYVSASGTSIYKGGNLKASYGDEINLYGGSSSSGANPKVSVSSTAVQLTKDSTHFARVNSDGMQVFSGSSSKDVADFGSAVRIGPTNSSYATIDSNGMTFKKNNTSSSFYAGRISFNTDSSTTQKMTIGSGTVYTVYTCNTTAKTGSLELSGGYEKSAKLTISGGSSSSLSITADATNFELSLDTSASSGVDHDLYAAINALGWASSVID